MKILAGIVATISVIFLLPPLFIKPWVRNKLEKLFNAENSNYIVTIEKVKVSIILSGIELKGIKISSKCDKSGNIDTEGEITSLKLNGISLTKVIFKKAVKIRKVTITEGFIRVKFSSDRDTLMPIVLPLDISLPIVHFERINLAVLNATNASSFSIEDCNFRLCDVKFEKHDTLSYDTVRNFEFEAKELFSVSADSMYLYSFRGVSFSRKTNTLTMDSVSIHPNYADYDFTSRYKYQKDRIEAGFRNIYVHNFDIGGLVRSGILKSSFVEIGKMNMKIFRDNRKEFQHINKPEFQDMIYNYRGIIRIDSIALFQGDITYTQHTLAANESGYISFNDIIARIYNITNDTIYKTDTAFFKLKADAVFMKKSRIAILLNARIFDSQNTFSLSGTLSSIEANELNPFIEKTAFIYINSGIINGMKFRILADHIRAHGTMTMLYERLDMTVKNKRTDDTTAFRERLLSWLVNQKVIDSNPLANQEVREGTIDYIRDPERSLIHYCGESILSGIRSSIIKGK